MASGKASCPICSEEFDSERGMKIHKTQVHDNAESTGSESEKEVNVGKKEDEVFHVGVKNPTELRRGILENSRDMVKFLKRYEKIKDIREEKKQAIKRLKKDSKDIREAINKLKEHLPRTKLRAKVKERELEFECEKCGMSFDSRTGLRKHMKVHDEEELEQKTKEEANQETEEETQEQTEENTKEEEEEPETTEETAKATEELDQLEKELEQIEDRLDSIG